MEKGLTIAKTNNDTNNFILTRYCDSDFAANKNDRRSVTCYLIRLNGSTIAWKSKKQSLTTLSSTEAEYVALSQCACELKFLFQLLNELGVSLQIPIVIHEDNAGTLFIVNNPMVGQRTKNIDTRYHFVRELVEENILQVIHISTDSNPADLFTNNLGQEKHEYFTSIIMKSEHEIEKKGC